MEWIAIVTALALIEYSVFGAQTGRARVKYGVEAPATTGNETFERHYRVQQNTVEQLVTFLPALWLFALYANAPIGAVVGLVFIVGRAVYAGAYLKDPSKRTVGFLMGFLANAVLLLGGLGGALVAAL